MSFKITTAVIDPDARKRELAQGAAGACVTFEGWVRNHNDADMEVRGRATQARAGMPAVEQRREQLPGAVAEGEAVRALEYEAHQLIAEKEGARIIAEATTRFAITAVHCEHRVGKLAVGDCAVWVGVAAAHRGAAFDACRYVIDETKARVPIWKKEHYASGATGWVNCATRTGVTASVDPERQAQPKK
jgi:molybdopterin synthase catalytic subunit